MLFLFGAIMLAIWAIALAFKITSALIHVVLAAALILFVLGFFRGRSVGRRSPL
jgi:VIT1/CCC1 family predicted Fe2+/Mn2+ transporter